MSLSETRRQKLRRNFKVIFWMKAVRNFKFLNVILSLFYLSRHLSLEHIFYLSIAWSIANLCLEVPSSYAADRWGRKKTILLGLICNSIYLIIYIFAPNLTWFIIGAMCNGAAWAFFSGTDEALLYDSKKELGEEDNTLGELGSFHSAERMFKIVTPIIAVFIAKDLSQIQFITLLSIDLSATLFALFLSTKLTEANHYMDLEQNEAGVMKDAIKLIRNNPLLAKAIFSRVFIFIGSLACWHYFQAFFTDMGVTVLHLGIGWSLLNLGSFILMRNIQVIKRIAGSVEYGIEGLNIICFLLVTTFLFTYFFMPNVPYFLYGLYLSFSMLETIRNPLYSEYFNGFSHSYNRATTISLTNFFKSALDIPVMLFASWLITMTPIASYWIAFTLCLISLLFFRIKKLPSTAS